MNFRQQRQTHSEDDHPKAIHLCCCSWAMNSLWFFLSVQLAWFHQPLTDKSNSNLNRSHPYEYKRVAWIKKSSFPHSSLAQHSNGTFFYIMNLYTQLINISLSPVLELLPPLHKSGQTGASLDPSLVASSKYVNYCSSDWLVDQQVKLKRLPWQKKPWILLYPPLNKLCLATFLWKGCIIQARLFNEIAWESDFQPIWGSPARHFTVEIHQPTRELQLLESELDLQCWYFFSVPWHAITRRGDHNGPWMFSKIGIGRRCETRKFWASNAKAPALVEASQNWRTQKES